MGLHNALTTYTSVPQFEIDFEALLKRAEKFNFPDSAITIQDLHRITVVLRNPNIYSPEVIEVHFAVGLNFLFREWERVTSQGADALIKHCTDLLLVKGREYTRSEDRLEAFKKAHPFSLVNTPAQVSWMYGCKQFTSLTDFLEDHAAGKDIPMKVWLEKFGDCANYIWLTWSCLAENYGRDRMDITIYHNPPNATRPQE